MATSIGTLAYKIVADTSGVTRGLVLTRKELSATKAIIEETKPPTVRYQQTMEGLGRLLQKNAITHEQYAAAVRKIRTEKLTAMPIIGKYVGAISSISTPLIALTAATGAAATAFRWFLREAEAIDALGETAGSIGMTARDMESLGYAVGRLSSTKTGDFVGAISKMSRAISEAARDSKKAESILLLGLDPTKLLATGTADAFRTIAEAIAQIRNPMDQVVASMAIFGKGAANMVPALAAGGREIAQLENRFRGLRGVMADNDAEMERAADAVQDLGISWDSLKRRIALGLAPRLSRGLQEASDLVASNGIAGAFASIHAFLKNLDADTGMPELVGLNPAVAERRKKSLLAAQEALKQRQEAEKIALKTQAEMARQQKDLRDKLIMEGARIHERNLTPFEKYRKGLAETAYLLRVGAISARDYGREARRLYGELSVATKPMEKEREKYRLPRFEETPVNVGAVKGSSEYGRAFVAQREKRVEVAYLKTMTAYLKRIAEREGKTVVMEEVGLG